MAALVKQNKRGFQWLRPILGKSDDGGNNSTVCETHLPYGREASSRAVTIDKII